MLLLEAASLSADVLAGRAATGHGSGYWLEGRYRLLSTGLDGFERSLPGVSF